MIDGSLRRVALVTLVLVFPVAFAAGPTPNLTSPSSTDGQEVTDLAFDPTGQYAMAVVAVDTGVAIPGNPLGGTSPVANKADVFPCDFGPVSTPNAAKSCISARHAATPTSTQSVLQSVSATSFAVSGGLTARFAVGGPAELVSLWSSTEQAPRWSRNVPGQQNGDNTVRQDVVNVSIAPDATRIAAVTEGEIGGTPRVVVYDGTGALQWEYNLTDADGAKTGLVPGAVTHSRDGRFLFVGLGSSANRGTLLTFDAKGAKPSALSALQPQALSGSVRDIAVSDNASAVAVGTSSGVYYFRIVGGQLQVPFYREPSADGVQAVALSRDGERFAAASGRQVHFYRHTGTTAVAEAIGSYATASHVADVAYDATGRLLVAAAGERVYGFTPGRTEPLWSFDATSGSAGLDAPLRKVAVSEGAERIVVAGRTKIMPYLTATAASLALVGDATRTAIPGTVVTVPFRVQNTGSLEDEFRFRAEGPVGWTARPPDPVALLPDGSALVNVTIEVPAGHAPGSFPLTLEAHSSALQNQSRTSLVASARTTLAVPRSVSLVLTPAEERFELPKQGEKIVPITIRNVGNAGGLVNLTIEQLPNRGDRWEVRLAEAQVNVDAAGERTVDLTVLAPTDGLSGDSNLITIVAREGSHEARRNVTAYVEPEFGAELIPLTPDTLEFTGRAAQTITVAVRNTGNTDDEYNITATVSGSAASDWRVTVHQEKLSVPRGGNRTVTITITPNVAEPRSATLTLRAISQGDFQGKEATRTLGLEAKPVEPTPPDEDGIPAAGALVALGGALGAAVVLRRTRGGRR